MSKMIFLSFASIFFVGYCIGQTSDRVNSSGNLSDENKKLSISFGSGLFPLNKYSYSSSYYNTSKVSERLAFYTGISKAFKESKIEIGAYLHYDKHYHAEELISTSNGNISQYSNRFYDRQLLTLAVPFKFHLINRKFKLGIGVQGLLRIYSIQQITQRFGRDYVNLGKQKIDGNVFGLGIIANIQQSISPRLSLVVNSYLSPIKTRSPHVWQFFEFELNGGIKFQLNKVE
jgi:hypothetical protein